jgi:hypothetical protein
MTFLLILVLIACAYSYEINNGSCQFKIEVFNMDDIEKINKFMQVKRIPQNSIFILEQLEANCSVYIYNVHMVNKNL